MKYNLFKVSAFSACIFNVSFAAFHKDALVSTSDGPVPMDLIRPGHMVLAYSPRLGSTGFSIVQAKNMASNNGFMVDINVGDRVIHAMPGQLLFDVASNSFVKARRLTSRHILFGEDSSLINIQDVKIRRRSSFSTPNEITLGNDHTLFVDGVLNHNVLGELWAGGKALWAGAQTVGNAIGLALALEEGANRVADYTRPFREASAQRFVIDRQEDLERRNRRQEGHFIDINQLPLPNQYSVTQARPASQSQSMDMHPGYVDIYPGPGSFYHNSKPVDGEISHAERVKARHKEVNETPVKDHEKYVDRSQHSKAMRQGHFENSAEGKRLKAMRERHDAGLPTLPEHMGRYKEEKAVWQEALAEPNRSALEDEWSRSVSPQMRAELEQAERVKAIPREVNNAPINKKVRKLSGHLLPDIKIMDRKEKQEVASPPISDQSIGQTSERPILNQRILDLEKHQVAIPVLTKTHMTAAQNNRERRIREAEERAVERERRAENERKHDAQMRSEHCQKGESARKERAVDKAIEAANKKSK
jgi:hypothetical protein